MSFFTTPDPRRPFQNVGQAIQQGLGAGFQQGIEQDEINKILSRINDPQNPIDPLEAILSSNLPASRQNNLAEHFQNKEKLQIEGANLLQKAQPKSDKLGEKFLEDWGNTLEQIGDLEIGMQNINQALESGQVSGRTNILGRFFPSASDQQLISGTKPFFAIGKNLFGPNLSKEQSEKLEAMFVAPGKSKAENQIAAQIMNEMLTLKKELNDIITNDPAIQSGVVTTADVVRIRGIQDAFRKQFFADLELKENLLKEAKKRGLL